MIVISDGHEKGHGLSDCTVKGYSTEVTEADLHVLYRATGWVSWYSRNQYCSRCGHVIQLVANESEKHCDTCGLSSYPSMSPALDTSDKVSSPMIQEDGTVDFNRHSCSYLRQHLIHICDDMSLFIISLEKPMEYRI